MLLGICLIYIICAICTGIAYFIHMSKYDSYTEDAEIQGAVICGIFWPIFYIVLILKKIIFWLTH